MAQGTLVVFHFAAEHFQQTSSNLTTVVVYDVGIDGHAYTRTIRAIWRARVSIPASVRRTCDLRFATDLCSTGSLCANLCCATDLCCTTDDNASGSRLRGSGTDDFSGCAYLRK